MSTATVRAYQPYFAGWFMLSGSRKSHEIKPFYRGQSTSLAQAHCIKDSVLLDETCGSGGFMARAKNNSEVIWSEQRSV